ncbi:MAG: ankyrin repeat domain-containing protein [Betaproteobacteria bacterium]
MRLWQWVRWVLAVSVLVAAPALAQTQGSSTPPEPAKEPEGPGRVIQGIGNAIQGVFRAIFGGGEPNDATVGTPPAKPAAESQPAPEPQSQSEDRAPRTAKGEGSDPVVATPSALAPAQTLHGAIAKGEDAAALKLLDGGADVEAKDPGSGASALHYAVMKDNLALVGVLLKRGADVNSRTRSGTTPLHTAVLYGRLEVAQFLIEKGAEINARSPSGATPLSIAEAANLKPLSRMLRLHGAN